MAVNPQWGMMQPVDIGGAFEAGRRQAQQAKQEAGAQAALQAYAANPDDPNVLPALAQYRPDIAIQLHGQRQQQAAATQERDIKMRAAQGDKQAIAQLAGIDWNAWSKLGQVGKDALKSKVDYLGNAALRISQLPEEARPQAWDAAVDQGVSLGYNDLAEQKGRYSAQALNSLIDNAGMVTKLFDAQKVDYKVIPEGGRAIGFDSMGRPLDASQTGAAPPPQPGAVDGGHRYIGGDPADPASWQPVQGGPTPTASGNFRGLSGEQVTSGYRTPQHNKAVKGVPYSYHTRKDWQGRALARDSVPPAGMSMSAYAAELKRLNPGMQVINEGDHVHIEPRG